MSSNTAAVRVDRVDPAHPEVVGEGRYERLAALAQQRGSLVVLAVTVLIASLVFNSFATADNARNIALQSSFLAVVALGMSFVIITGGIDLSVGSVYALGGVLAAYGSKHGSLVAFVLPLAVCGLIGLINGLLVARVGMPAFIVTLTTLLFARGLLLSITDQGATTYTINPSSVFAKMGQGSLWSIGYPVFIAFALFLVGGVVLQRTRFGQAVFAIGGSEDAARLMGLSVNRVKVSVYTMSGVLAGFGGMLAAAQASSGVTIVGVGLELSAISAVVIGGTLLSGGAGNLSGTLAGVALLGVIQNVINQIGSLNSSYQAVVNGAFLVLVVVGQTFLSRQRRL